MINKIKNIKPKVLKLLQDMEMCRDSDNILLSYIWVNQIGESIYELSAIQLLRIIRQGELPNAESVRRTRQKIQEHHPELRGESYKARKQKAVETKQQIKGV